MSTPSSPSTPSLMVRQDDPEQAVATSTAGRAIRRAIIWVVLLVLAVGTAIVAVSAITGGIDGGVPLAADNPAPSGAMAVAEVLRDQGVDVIETEDLDATLDAVDDPEDTTVLLWDIDLLLSPDQHDRLLRAGTELVVLDPTFFEIEDLAPELALGGGTSGTFEADCDLTAVEKAGTVVGEGSSYRIPDDAYGPGIATGCLADDDRYGLVQVEDGGRAITLLGVTSILTNENVATEGNAALALNLLGERGTLIWYIPSVEDLSDQPASIADLTPPWVVPFCVLAVLVALGAIFWRSRRVGPLVVENLPVVVRASETMEGRARLYDRTNSRLHALDALRIGALTRLARRAGLPRTATVDEVVDAVAALTGRDRADVARILRDGDPASDAELVTLSDDLQLLETAAAERSRP